MTHPLPEQDQFATLPTAPGGLQLCYRRYGPAQGQPVLLLAGLGLQLTSWPQALVQALVDAGHPVLAPDNRDAGLSARLPTRPPGLLGLSLGRVPARHYGLEDMADDMHALLQHLGLPAVHVVGMSMGGMVGQVLATRRPQQVLSLTSIFSTTGARGVGQPALSTRLRMGRAAPRSQAQAVAAYVDMMGHIGNPQVPGAQAGWEAYAAQAWQRNGGRANVAGMLRQIAAVLKSGDRTAQLRQVRAPTLVLHGDRDLMVHPSGGHATAQAIAGARHVVLPGLAHQLDSARAPVLAGHILPHLRRAAAHSLACLAGRA